MVARGECTRLDQDAFHSLLDEPLACAAGSGLRALGEKPLTPDGFQSAYRFLWLRAFAPPMAFRLNIAADGSGALTVKIADAQPVIEKYPPRVRQHMVVVEKADVDSFIASLERADFWTLKPSDVPPGARDGSYWVVEAQVGSRYRSVLRWSPKAGAFRDAALLLIKLSGEQVSDVY